MTGKFAPMTGNVRNKYQTTWPQTTQGACRSVRLEKTEQHGRGQIGEIFYENDAILLSIYQGFPC